MKPKFSLLAVLMLAVTLALVGVLRDVGTSKALMPLPTQPFLADAQGGLADTKLGNPDPVDNLTFTYIPRGSRTTLPWIFSGPGFELTVDKETEDETIIGSVKSLLDAQCDSVDLLDLDTLCQKPCTTCRPYDWVATTTKVEGTGAEFLKSITPPFSWLARHTAWTTPPNTDKFLDYICLAGGTLGIKTSAVLNTVYTNIPWAPNGSTFTATTKLGGDPVVPPSSTCLDSPQTSTSIVDLYHAPALEGDSDGPCDRDDYQCADAAVNGVWTDNTVSLNASAVTTKVVSSVNTNNGLEDEDGTFTAHWEVELTNPTIMSAGWTVGPGYAATEDYPVTLEAGKSVSDPNTLYLGCKASPLNGEGLVVIKKVLWPTGTTKDTYADDNAFVFVMKVICANGAPAVQVDKEVIWIKPVVPTEDHLQLTLGETKTVIIDELKANHYSGAETGTQCTNTSDDDVDTLVNDGCPAVKKAETVAAGQCADAADAGEDTPADGVANDGCPAVGPDVVGQEWLVAEVADNNLAVSWGDTVSVSQEDTEPDVVGATDCDAGDACITYPVTEPLGQSDVVAQLDVQCDLEADPGLYSVVVKGIDAPVSVNGGVPAGEVKPSDNAQRSVIKVWCGIDYGAETGTECDNAADDDDPLDGKVNDGCPAVDAPETVAQCANDDDDDDDDVVNDGCPASPGAGTLDGIEDANGLYARWTLFQSVGISGMQINGDTRKSFQSPPSFRSDTGYVERYVDLQCYWLDKTGCDATHGACDGSAGTLADGFIDEMESWNDPDLEALGGIEEVDSDEDCAMDADYAQPSHPVDSLDEPTLKDCDEDPADPNWVVYSEKPNVIHHDTAADRDCDGLVDGVERAYGSNPLSADTDSDGASDFVEIFQFSNPLNPDTDGDGLPDRPENNYQASAAGVADPSGPETVCNETACPDADSTPGAAPWQTCDDDNDGKINDGCPKVGKTSETGTACNDNVDAGEDTPADGVVNDGCSKVTTEYVNWDDNCPGVANPLQENNDGKSRANGSGIEPSQWASNPSQDKIGDACDADDDGDLLPDAYETATAYSDPFKMDSDGDTVIDGYEVMYEYDPMVVGGPPPPGTPYNKPTWNNAAQLLARGCHFNMPVNSYSDWATEYDAIYNNGGSNHGENNVEMDVDGDGITCPTDVDSDNGLLATEGQIALDEVSDKIEAFGYGTGVANPDTDGDGCADWIEMVDVDLSRTATIVDVLVFATRALAVGAPSTDSDPLLDLDKTGSININDVLLAAKNSSLIPAKTVAKCPDEF